MFIVNLCWGSVQRKKVFQKWRHFKFCVPILFCGHVSIVKILTVEIGGTQFVRASLHSLHHVSDGNPVCTCSHIVVFKIWRGYKDKHRNSHCGNNVNTVCHTAHSHSLHHERNSNPVCAY